MYLCQYTDFCTALRSMHPHYKSEEYLKGGFILFIDMAVNMKKMDARHTWNLDQETYWFATK